ncbi:MAG: hypothetical protein M3O25_11000 [Actinomycetota bacterium]|nr:hypothetical protein [Actinomycetota bacterium]
MSIEFYDVKRREKVSVPESEVRKVRYERTTKSGKPSVRHALRATHEGSKLTTFVSKDTWEALDAPVESA